MRERVCIYGRVGLVWFIEDGRGGLEMGVGVRRGEGGGR